MPAGTKKAKDDNEDTQGSRSRLTQASARPPARHTGEAGAAVPVLEKRKRRLVPRPAGQIQNLIQTGWPGALACHHHTLLSPKTPRDPGWSPAGEVPQRTA